MASEGQAQPQEGDRLPEEMEKSQPATDAQPAVEPSAGTADDELRRSRRVEEIKGLTDNDAGG